jgi:hypothetical protein
MKFKWRHADALARSGRRWSPWRILALPLGFACAIGVFLFADNMTLDAQVLLAPDKVFYCSRTHWSDIVLFLVIALPSVPVGLAIANLILWTIPPVRAALKESEARAGETFARANAGLVKFASLSVLLLLPIYLFAAGSKVCLSNSEIYSRSHILSQFQTYDLSQVAAVRPRCTKGSRGGWDIGLDIVMNDGSSFDLAIGPRFSSSSDRILGLLGGARPNASDIQAGCPAGFRRRIQLP